MFEPSGLGETIFKERYAIHPEESYEEACVRLADTASKAEEPGDKQESWQKRFTEELQENRFMPGGRIWYGAGRPVQQMLNCYVIPTADSAEGWGKMISDLIVISSTGGGVGINFSPIRPRGSKIAGRGGVATGAVSLMQMANSVGDVLVAGGGRRIAMMHCLDITHPDVEEFIHAKLDLKQLNNANVSVVLEDLDPEQFRRMVENDEQIPLQFRGLPTGESVSAKELWAKISINAYNSGEPGVLNSYLANRDNSIGYRHKLLSTNPCGEIWLPGYGCCCLGALVLPRFVSDGSVDWDSLDATIRSSVRFLDNILTVNHYPLPEIQAMCQGERRIGLGVMGLHSMLLDLGLEYGSPDCLSFVAKLFNFIKATAYHSSIDLAIEKGTFGFYDQEFRNTGFAKRLKPSLRRRIKEHGIRNCALLTIAPTGTTSMVCGVTSGVEPLFAPAYLRRRKTVDAKGRSGTATTLVISKEYLDHGENAKGAYDVDVSDHFEMQVTVQAHIDNAVSKTINLPNDYNPEKLEEMWLKYLPAMKGSTFYRAGSRGEEPLEAIPVDKVEQAMVDFEGEELEFENMNQECSVDGSCD